MDRNIFAVHRLTETAILPQRKTRHAVGFDLFATGTITVQPHSTATVDTGLRVLLPAGCFGKIESRSSLAQRMLFCCAGVIDPDYTGELKVLLINHGESPIEIPYGHSCAQFILVRVSMDQRVPVELSNEILFMEEHNRRYTNNARLERGFGSTDKPNCLSLPYNSDM